MATDKPPTSTSSGDIPHIRIEKPVTFSNWFSNIENFLVSYFAVFFFQLHPLFLVAVNVT